MRSGVRYAVSVLVTPESATESRLENPSLGRRENQAESSVSNCEAFPSLMGQFLCENSSVKDAKCERESAVRINKALKNPEGGTCLQTLPEMPQLY